MKPLNPHPTSALRRARPAFTLVELLTVIAIIAILAVILIPVVSSVRDSARQTGSVSNLRSIGSAMSLYVGEHSGLWPSPVETTSGGTTYPMWKQALVSRGYFDDAEAVVDDELEGYHNHPALSCPIQVDRYSTATRNDSFAMNRLLGRGNGVGPEGPMGMARLSEAALVTHGAFSGTTFADVFHPSSPRPDAPVKGNSLNILYGDGHVATIGQDEVPADADTSNRDAAAFWLGANPDS